MLPEYNGVMQRLQIQLDKSTYEALRLRAFEGRVSMASVVRSAIQQALDTPSEPRHDLADFRFVGAGSSEGDEEPPVSVDHDRAIADAIQSRFEPT